MSAAHPAEAAPLCLPPRPLARRPRVMLPEGTVDCHFHAFAPSAPLATPRSYTPHVLGLGDWLSFADAVGIAKGVLVQPSVYGFDNTVLLAALDQAPDRLRGIVVPHPDTGADELEAMHQRGVRGIRCNARNLGGLGLERAIEMGQAVVRLGWILQLQVGASNLADLRPILATLKLPVVLDHFGFVDADDETAAVALRALLDTGQCYVKLSAPYRLQNAAPVVSALAKALVSARPERLLWGSDWPHTELWQAVPDDAELIEQALDWLGDAAHQIMVTNPERLFFPS